MSTHGMFAASRSRRIVCSLLYAMALQWSSTSHAEDERSSSGRRTVYRCMHDDVLTLTDIPCNGERVEIDLNRNLSVAQPMASPDSSRVRAHKDGHTPRRAATATDAAEQRREKQARCDRLRTQLDTLQSKLRRGYTAAAGVRLEERKRQLREQARSAKCP